MQRAMTALTAVRRKRGSTSARLSSRNKQHRLDQLRHVYGLAQSQNTDTNHKNTDHLDSQEIATTEVNSSRYGEMIPQTCLGCSHTTEDELTDTKVPLCKETNNSDRGKCKQDEEDDEAELFEWSRQLPIDIDLLDIDTEILDHL